MKYLFINVVAGNASTGKIAAEQCRKLQKEGHECVLAYGRLKVNCDDIETMRIGNKLDYEIHGVLTRLFGINGFASKRATKNFLKWAEEYNPDVVWLHNIHGYYINVEMLFAWIKSRPNMQVRWTLHDCWAFTGHCTYFMVAKCMKWKQSCVNCTQLHEYPACYGIANVRKNYERKKKAFTGVQNMTIVTPSKWLADLVKDSFLREYPVEVVYNKIDNNLFKYTPSDFRDKYNLQGKKIILGVANIWDKRKGLEDFYKLAQMLDKNYAIVIVGMSKKQIEDLPNKIAGVKCDDNVNDIVKIYVKCGNENISEKESENISLSLLDSKVVKQNINELYEAITGCKFEGNNDSKMTCDKFICIQHTNSATELAKIYSAADIFVNTTYEDNYPTVNLEALACGTMVITYDTGGCRETVEQGICTFGQIYSKNKM